MGNMLEEKVLGRGSSAFVLENLLFLVGCCHSGYAKLNALVLYLRSHLGDQIVHTKLEGSDKRVQQTWRSERKTINKRSAWGFMQRSPSALLYFYLTAALPVQQIHPTSSFPNLTCNETN